MNFAVKKNTQIKFEGNNLRSRTVRQQDVLAMVVANVLYEKSDAHAYT